MTRTQALAERLRELFLYGRWIANTNYKEQLESLSREQATYKIGDLNTIALLTFHVNYYLAGLNNVFRGGDLEIRDKFSFDAPPITSEQDWRDRISTLLANAEEFARHVETMDDSLLDQPFVQEKYGTYLRNIEGVLEHSYYHFGQISMLKKLGMAEGGFR